MKLSRAAAVLAATACSLVLAPVAAAHDDDSSSRVPLVTECPTDLAAVAAAHDDDSSSRDEESDLPLVIGHRGTPGCLPDHTLEGYKLAIQMGADYIEPDLVSTKDGHLIARHEPNIGDTTDVAAKFPESRKSTKNVDGADITNYFASDFTLKEIKTLRAKQPLGERPQQYNGRFSIPTFDEVLALAKKAGRERGRPVGVYPETKHPTFHEEEGKPLERKLVASLRRFGLNDRHDPVYIQSFEQSNLRFLNRITPVKLTQLVDAWDVDSQGRLVFAETSLRPYDWTVAGGELATRTYGYFATNAGLDEIATYAEVISPWKPFIVAGRYVDANMDGTPDDLNGDRMIDERDRKLTAPTSLIRRAHRRGLDVHTWTFRDEPRRLASDYAGSPAAEYNLFFALGVDGVFSDLAATAVAARNAFFAG